MPAAPFYPPRLNPALVRVCQWIVPLYGRFWCRMMLDVDPTSLAILKSLQRERILLLSNHPSFFDDWISIFLLSARVEMAFHFLAAQERFRGLEGPLIQRLGTYSVRRGLGDRASVAETIRLWSSPSHRLVIFPEGGCSFQNDVVTPFRVGGIQMAFQGLNKIAKTSDEIPDLYVIPISIKYRYISNMVPVIDQTLIGLEKALELSPSRTRSLTFYQRLRAIAERVINQFEVEHGLDTSDVTKLSWNERIDRLRNHLLESCEQILEISINDHQLLRERVYKIQYLLETKGKTLVNDPFWTYEKMQQVTISLLNFDAIYDGYVAAAPTPERFLDTLIRLERQVFKIDYPTPKARRKVLIKVGKPVNLKEYYGAYRGDRPGTVAHLTKVMEDMVQRNLNILNQDS
ncbi:MAG: 1-acyl-sn-glycerol-3-phosphate acyltransferase [Leptolyngbyaceae bacterium]|nr:1-acyl-sn-glycerol-3-phosphate acyltransferase [Leptolyngbyaceae bacterium]